jgi:hypothetical protein
MAFELDPAPIVPAGPASAAESSEIIDGMPEPQEHVIQQMQGESTDATGDTSDMGSGDKDAAGEVWDPAKHATGKDGKGVKTANDLWRRRKGLGGIARPSSVHRPPNKEAQEQAQKTAEALNAQARAAGAAAAASIFMIGRAIGGEDWNPTEPEVRMQTDAWGNYFVAKGITDFPPGIALSIAVLGYAGPRFFTPKTRERAGAIKHWIAVRIAKRRVKKALKKQGIDAVVTIKGVNSANVYDSILINGKPFNEFHSKE